MFGSGFCGFWKIWVPPTYGLKRSMPQHSKCFLGTVGVCPTPLGGFLGDLWVEDAFRARFCGLPGTLLSFFFRCISGDILVYFEVFYTWGISGDFLGGRTVWEAQSHKTTFTRYYPNNNSGTAKPVKDGC